MTAEVIQAKFGPRVPDDMPGILRDLAKNIEDGVVTGIVVACHKDGNFEFYYGTSLSDSIVLSNMMAHRAYERMKS